MFDVDELIKARVAVLDAKLHAHLLRLQGRLDALEKLFLLTFPEEKRHEVSTRLNGLANGATAARLDQLRSDNPEFAHAVTQVLLLWSKRELGLDTGQPSEEDSEPLDPS